MSVSFDSIGLRRVSIERCAPQDKINESKMESAQVCLQIKEFCSQDMGLLLSPTSHGYVLVLVAGSRGRLRGCSFSRGLGPRAHGPLR